MTSTAVPADVAVVFGSGLAVLPDGATVEREIPVADLGWPSPSVEGHGAGLTTALLRAGPPRRSAPAAVRLALLQGRPHLYEGWSEEELERAVTDLAARGTARFLLLNACGSLRREIAVGEVVVATELVDLQSPPSESAPRFDICEGSVAERVSATLGGSMPARPGVYVAVPGPQYETPAEAAWLARYGDVVGMSTAPEVRAAGRSGAEVCLLSLVVNQAAAVGSHDDVLATAARFRSGLAGALAAVLAARWPVLFTPT